MSPEAPATSPLALCSARKAAPARDLEILAVDDHAHVVPGHARELDAHHDGPLGLVHVERGAPRVGAHGQAHRAGQRTLEGAVHLLFELGQLARDLAPLYVHFGPITSPR